MNFDASVLQVAIEDIIPNRFQPRLVFEDTSLNELAESIKQHGIIQPLVLRRMGEKYEIVAGERRYRAAKLAGLVSVPAVISNIDDKKSAEIAISENVQRKELNAIEEAKSYKALLDQGYMTQSQLATKLGLSDSAIDNKLKLLTLAPEVQNALLEDKISERHARSLLLIKNPDDQVKWLLRVINERMPVRILDLELRKEYGEIYMNNGLDIDKMKQNSTDIPIAPVQSSQVQNQVNFGPIDLGQKVVQNKFFNSLENEAVNMQTTENINPFTQQQNSLFDTTIVPGTSGTAPITQPSFAIPTPDIQNNGLMDVNNSMQPTSPAPSVETLDSIPPMPNTISTSPNVMQNPQPSPFETTVTTTPLFDLNPEMQNGYAAPAQQLPNTSNRSMNEVKTKINSLVEELRALGYNVSNSETENGNSASFNIMVNIN